MSQPSTVQSPTAAESVPLSALPRIRRDAPAANDPVARVVLTAVELQRRARDAKSSALARIIAASLAYAWASLRQASARYRQHRDALETMRALRGLDDRTLHDLGYHRSEIESVAIELTISQAR